MFSVKKKLSIITINKNNLVGLKKTHLSVQSQIFKDFEHIIIDGNSTDGSKEYILNNQKDFFKFKVESDNGIYDAMNKGIKLANSNFILCLNSGDVLFDNFSLENLFLEIKKNKSEKYVFYYTNVIIKKNNSFYQKKYLKKLTPFYLSNEIINHQSQIISTDVLKKNLFNLKYKLASDYELCLRLIFKKKIKYKHLDLNTSIYNLDGISSSKLGIEIYQKEHAEIRTKYFPNELERINELVFYQNSETELKTFKSKFFLDLIFIKLNLIFEKYTSLDNILFYLINFFLKTKKLLKRNT